MDTVQKPMVVKVMPTDKPSQMSDAFRLGVAWALKKERKAGKWKDGGDAMAGAMAGM